MAAITATDWTVTIENQTIQAHRRVNHCKLVLTSGGTYPSDGIPRPVNGTLGMRRNLSHIIIADPDSTNHIVRYDKDNGTFVLHKLSTASITAQDLVELATTATVGTSQLGTIYIDAIGW
jgi:hypothetical protein